MKGEQNFGVRVHGTYPSDFSFDKIIEIDTYDGYNFQDNENYKIKYEKQIIDELFILEETPSLIRDLIRISLATFCADQLVEREVALKKRKEKRYRSRKINLSIHVSDKEKWNDIKRSLEKTISFMTYDSIRYKFRSKSDIQKEYIEIKENESKFDSIALFSGGTDSFIGSYYLREEKGFNPQYLHLAHSNTKSLVKNHLKGVLPDESLEIMRIDSKYKSKEYTQFSRSFMYLSFASAFALARGVNKVFIPENGIIARQIGLGKGRLTTRTAHPKFLRLYNNFLKKLLPEDIKLEIENPFKHKSKREIIDLIQGDSEIENLMRKKLSYTISCAHSNLKRMHGGKQKTENGKPYHCGVGIPCLIRIISTISSELQNKEDKVKLQYNPFLSIDFNDVEDTYLPSNFDEEKIKRLESYYRNGVLNIYEILELAYDIKENNEDIIYSKYPEFYDDEVYDLYKDFSENVISTVKYYSNKNKNLRSLISQFKN